MWTRPGPYGAAGLFIRETLLIRHFQTYGTGSFPLDQKRQEPRSEMDLLMASNPVSECYYRVTVNRLMEALQVHTDDKGFI